MTRRLVLRSDRLTELTTAELADVVGGAQTKECLGTYYCLTEPGLCDGTRVICT